MKDGPGALTRRRFAVGALSSAALAALAGLELASFRGAFDHRRAPAGGPARLARRAEGAGPAFEHIGHSTHLLTLAGARILTDPWFFDPAFGALEHEAPPAASPEELGALDVVLVSHDHPDHADLRAMDRMDKRATVLVATRELGARVRSLGFAEVHALAPWEALTLGRGGVKVTAVPALHDVPEIGFVLESGATSVYFAGDTRLHPDLDAIAERFRPRVAILPVDGTRIRGEALAVMTPADAVTAARLLGSELVIPSHGEARVSDPVAAAVFVSHVEAAPAVFADLAARALPAVRCVVPRAGEPLGLPG